MSRTAAVITADFHIECDPPGYRNRFSIGLDIFPKSQKVSMLGSRDINLGHFCICYLKVLRLRFLHHIEKLILQQKMKEFYVKKLPFTHSSHLPCGLHTEIMRCCCYLALLGAAKRERSREQRIGVWGCIWVGRVRKRSMQHMEPWGGDGRSGEIKGAHSLRLLMQTVGGGCAGRLWKVGLGAMFKLEL